MATSPDRYTMGLVRSPGPGFERGLTGAGLGPPDLDRALAQHAAYCEALEEAGIRLIRLPPDPRHPDGTFVEDTLVMLHGAAVATRPAAASRRGEVDAVAEALPRSIPKLELPWGELDGGDVLVAGDRVFIGRSSRTDRVGARSLAGIVSELGLEAVEVPVLRGLHLKTGVTLLGHGALLMTSDHAGSEAFQGFDAVVVPEEERYAANGLWVRDRVLLAAGHPRTTGRLLRRGCAVVELEMSEFRKMDGGLTCLSVLW
ncbi:MAG: hypothetical protein FJ098_12445 [Deltaproteobacteria bacterium]|nr:hypothetical protein [Deltaproteobacteria bacterium]